MPRNLVTQGEKLYDHICSQISTLPTVRATKGISDFALRTTNLLEFVDGAIRFHALARVLRFARLVISRDDIQSTETQAIELRRLCLEKLEIGEHNCADIDGFLILALGAARQAKKKVIPKAERRTVLNDYKARGLELRCYICHGELDETAKSRELDLSSYGDAMLVEKRTKRLRQPNPRYVGFDHVWPRSLGGDTTSENLLPVCIICNRVKEQLVSWEWALVQASVWPPDRYSKGRLDKRVWKDVKIALHMRAALRIADQFNLTLKRAFLHLGPRKPLRVVDDEDTTDFFNLEIHDGQKLSSLWD